MIVGDDVTVSVVDKAGALTLGGKQLISSQLFFTCYGYDDVND